jgi:DtxR family Mn-dependent transcriptional regulator
VSEALSKLVSKGLITYNRYEFISLTKAGEKEAKRVYEKHHILADFFENVLGVSSLLAGENACKIEHIVSGDILSRMEKFTKFFKTHKKILDLYIEESEK